MVTIKILLVNIAILVACCVAQNAQYCDNVAPVTVVVEQLVVLESWVPTSSENSMASTAHFHTYSPRHTFTFPRSTATITAGELLILTEHHREVAKTETITSTIVLTATSTVMSTIVSTITASTQKKDHSVDLDAVTVVIETVAMEGQLEEIIPGAVWMHSPSTEHIHDWRDTSTLTCGEQITLTKSEMSLTTTETIKQTITPTAVSNVCGSATSFLSTSTITETVSTTATITQKVTSIIAPSATATIDSTELIHSSTANVENHSDALDDLAHALTRCLEVQAALLDAITKFMV